MDLLGKLMFAATLRRAAALEQWLYDHRDHYPPPCVEHSDDSRVATARCVCGEEVELSILTDVLVKVKPAKWPAA